MRHLIFFLLSFFMLACQQEDARQATSSAPVLDFDTHFDGRFHLPEGWTSTLWAESPQFFNPTNMDVDARGRIWITEAVNYRDFNNKPDRHKHFEQGDRIVILEDTDEDGVADSSKVFVQDKDLVAPLGIAVIGNRVVVSCAPNVLIYTDEDGDDHPDKKEVFLTGFGGYDHDHSVHAFVAGPDGKWYFNTGNAGPHTVTDRSGWTLRSGSMYTGGSPYNQENSGNRRSDDGRVWVGGLALRINPDGTGLEVLAHNFRNAYELTIDSYGDLWQNDNDDQVETCRATWLMYGGNAGYFSEDGTRNWQADQRPGQSMFTAHWHQDDPGVIPAGDNTGAGSPTGVLVYEGDAFGDRYRGMFLNVDAGRNVIFAYQPQMQSAGFALNRRELIRTVGESTEGYVWNELTEDTTKWFRPSDMVVGTDGALYIADWYDPVVGGHQMHDTIGYGRIYRITPEGEKLRRPAIDLSTTAGQLQALRNPAINVRNLGFQKLRAQGESVLPEVQVLLESENPFHRARALWLLTSLGSKGVRLVEEVLASESDPRLRVAAYRALVQAQPENLLHYAETAATDPAPAVRRAVAVSLESLPFEESEPVFQTLFENFDGHDRWYVVALGIGARGHESDLYRSLVSDQPSDPLRWDSAFATLAWRLHPEVAVPAFKARALAEDLTQAPRQQALTALGFTPGNEAATTMVEISRESTDPRVQKMAQWWVDFRRSNLWLDALDWEADAPEKKLPPEIAEAEQMLREKDSNLNAQIEAAQTLAAHPQGGMRLVRMAAGEQLPKELLANPEIADALFNNPEREVRVLAGEYFSSPEASSLSVPSIAQVQGEAARGAELFVTHCSSCHQIDQVGKAIGPSLKHIRAKFGKTALIDAIVHPNGAVTFGYEPVLIATTDDQVYSGFLLSEGEATVIKDLAGKRHTIRSADIAEKNVMQNSLMPSASALGLEAQGVADIVAYLRSLR